MFGYGSRYGYDGYDQIGYYRRPDYILAEPGLPTRGPEGHLVTPTGLAEYLGGLETSTASGLLARVIAGATEIVEDTLGYSFRERDFTARINEGNANVPIWLPWGPARNVTVAPDTLTVETEVGKYRHVTLACVDSEDEYTLSWTVGATTGYPDEVVLEVMRIAATLWHERGAGQPNMPMLRDDVVNVLARYKTRPDFE